MTGLERLQMRRGQLLDGTVGTLAALDDLEATVRRLECERIARALREVAGSPDYWIGKYDPAIVNEIANQIERSR